jgi:hypothetical protein
LWGNLGRKFASSLCLETNFGVATIMSCIYCENGVFASQEMRGRDREDEPVFEWCVCWRRHFEHVRYWIKIEDKLNLGLWRVALSKF